MEAMNKFLTKEANEIKKLSPVDESGALKVRKKRNASPEKDVEKACLIYMRKLSWDVQIYESKATWDTQSHQWKNQSMKAGNADCQGVMPDGIAVAVEFKAPGKLSTFNLDKNYRQKEFIIKRINQNAFACVVDSADLLHEIYIHWQNMRVIGAAEARDYLLRKLP